MGLTGSGEGLNKNQEKGNEILGMFIFLIRDERFKEIAGDILDKNWDIEEKEKEIGALVELSKKRDIYRNIALREFESRLGCDFISFVFPSVMLEYIESLEKSLFEESEIVKDLTKELIEGIIKNGKMGFKAIFLDFFIHNSNKLRKLHTEESLQNLRNFFENFDYKSLENLLIVILLREDLRPEQKFDELKAIYEISKLQGEYKYFVLSDVSQGHLLPTIAHRKAIVAYLISKHVRPS